MQQSYKFKAALFAVGLLFSTDAVASCFNENASTRLRSYCLTESLIGSSISLENANTLDVLLQREGYNGFGIWQPVSSDWYNTFLAPEFYFSNNVNGGNPRRPLILGNLSFTGAEENYAKSGIVTGLNSGLNGRFLTGEGKYIDYTLAASYVYSPQHSLSIARGSANICSRNFIVNQWYIDACGDTTRLVRDLVAETNSGLSLSAAKLFGTGNGAFHSASFGVRRYYAEEYQQNQIQLGWNTVRNRGAYTSFNFSFGEAVPNHLAQRRSVSATLGTTVFDRALSATASYSYADGGKILGFERDEITRSITINYAITNSLSVNVGFREVDSSIDYFSEREPIVSLQFAPIRF